MGFVLTGFPLDLRVDTVFALPASSQGMCPFDAYKLMGFNLPTFPLLVDFHSLFFTFLTPSPLRVLVLGLCSCIKGKRGDKPRVSNTTGVERDQTWKHRPHQGGDSREYGPAEELSGKMLNYWSFCRRCAVLLTVVVEVVDHSSFTFGVAPLG